VKNITISSPQDAPNTDGIHLQNTRDVETRKSNIGYGIFKLLVLVLDTYIQK
jgi:galacturan 1,4-alpha-galacturonidase